MSDPQGRRPLDPYQALQLHPRAPRELIVQAYWILIADQKRSSMAGAAAGARISELNAAYALLLDDDARAAYDEDHPAPDPTAGAMPPTRRFGGLGFKKQQRPPDSNQSNLYDVLRVAREAHVEIIEAAHAVMAHQSSGPAADRVLLRDRLDEARDVLSDPERRAAYDASLAPVAMDADSDHAPATPPGSEPASASADVTQPATQANLPVLPPTQTMMPAPPQPDLVKALERTTVEPAAAVPPPAEARPLDAAATVTMRLAVATAGADAPLVPVEQSSTPGDGDATPVWGARLLSNARRHLKMPSRPAEDPLPTDVEHRRRAASGRTGERQTIAAESARLMTLLEPELAAAPGIATVAGVAGARILTDAPIAALVFVSGPRSGETIQLGGDAVTLGANAASDVVLDCNAGMGAYQARIWLHGQHFIFRQLDGGITTIGGEPLTLPMVMLDDGDEIQIGDHRLRFGYQPK